MPASAPPLRPEIQFATLEQQGDTAQLGMWAFLVNETLFFGALIFTYYIYRMSYPHEFAVAAKDAVLRCGSVNLVILLTSSLTMVLAINAGAQGGRQAMIGCLIVTAALGCVFLLIKGYEYYQDFQDADKAWRDHAGLLRATRSRRHLLELCRFGLVVSLPLHLPGGTVMTIRPDIHPKRARPLPFVVAWAVMLVLAGLSLLTAFLGLGVWAPVVQFGIAAIQVSALFILFMHLKGPPSLKWVFAITRFLWLSFLYGLSMTDYSNRRGWPPLYTTTGPGFEAHENGP